MAAPTDEPAGESTDESGDEPAVESTRDALIAAGLHCFGHKGFAAASTREIAARAGANVAAIAYHFGGKEGLRAACAETVAARMGGILDPLDPPGADTPAAARAVLDQAIRAVTLFLASAPGVADIAAFLLREITDPGPAFDRIYAETIGPRHAALCRLWGLAAGTDPEAEATRLAVFAMMGQVLYFRIGRPVILRRMDWEDITPDRAAAIADLLAANLHAALDATERTAP
ncbi:CerR family C-terminal domain-containing protein [Acidimangrovimonas pyrenivorans]|uniref:CerR family C-terminal domain-containing protein n=1 Tax=Acidimangrovimonas pyrenivorans TaxID=2030798 RepID=A0ABV7AKW8_9RHOB